MKRYLLLAFTLSTSSLALAHPGHGASFAAAFAHPLTGLDHLLMMLFVGVWATKIGGAARWQLPLIFLIAITVGFFFGTQGIHLAGVESGIAAGLIALGALLAVGLSLPRVAQISFIAVSALLHGLAHGTELSGGSLTQTFIGFIAATALLHGAGIMLAQQFSQWRNNFYRAAGVLLSMIGAGFLAGIY